MQSFHFGSSKRTLFGTYHMAKTRAPRAPAVVLCNAFGEEAVRSYRIMRLLALKLSRQGSPVLRFDYFGTGDSAGLCTQMDIEGGTKDILSAHEEILDVSGASKAVWVGLRLGASQAMKAAARRASGLDGLVLWDPVVSGRDYERELTELQVNHLAYCYDQPAEAIRKRLSLEGNRLRESVGFELGDGFSDQLQALDLLTLDGRTPRKVVSIGASFTDQQNALHQKLEAGGTELHTLNDPEADSWNSDQAMNGFVVPAKILDYIAKQIGEWR